MNEQTLLMQIFTPLTSPKGFHGFESSSIMPATPSVMAAVSCSAPDMPEFSSQIVLCHRIGSLNSHLNVLRAITIFLLGGRPGLTERAATSLTQQYPEMQINGTHHGYLETAQKVASSRAKRQTDDLNTQDDL